MAMELAETARRCYYLRLMAPTFPTEVGTVGPWKARNFLALAFPAVGDRDRFRITGYTMLISLILLLLLGFFAGQIAQRLGIPPLVGMVVAGVLLGPEVGRSLAPEFLAMAGDLRTLAMMAILMKAGLGLDRQTLAQQSSVALRLGCLPALGEMLVIAGGAIALLGFDGGRGLLLGCMIAAESPAVIVPGMLRLKSLGWGVKKGIPDAILTGSALSNVLLLLLFSLLLTLLSRGNLPALPGGLVLSPWIALPGQLLLQLTFGVGVGLLAAQGLILLLTRQRWTQTLVQDTLVAALLLAGLLVLAQKLPIFSGYLAVVTAGLGLVEWDRPLARRLRMGFDGLWTVAEIALFGLLGASLPLPVLGQAWGPGLVLLLLGTLTGRAIGWALATWGSNWHPRERLFLLPGNSAKATVQAAIGAIPLAQGIPGGETMLAIAGLSILVTAPLGAWAIPTFAPRLLQRDAVDPTRVNVNRPMVLVAAVDTSPQAIAVLRKTAELARRSQGEVLVIHVVQREEPEAIAQLQSLCQSLLADVRHRWIALPGVIPETILDLAQTYGASEIIVAKHNHPPLGAMVLGSVSRTLLTTSAIPVLVVEEGGDRG